MHPKAQNIKARLQLLESEVHTAVKDGSYNVYEVNGSSSLGEPYEYEVVFISPSKLKVENLADISVEVSLEDELNKKEARIIYGRVFSASEASIVADKYLYNIKVVHPLYYLGETKRYEIYQDMSAMEIIEQIIKQYAGVLDLDFISSAPPRRKREYTTQYEQSDLAFIQMLCQEEGVTLNLQGDKLSPYGEVEEKFVVRLDNINDNYRELQAPLESYYNRSKTFKTTHYEEDYYDFKAPSHEYSKTTGSTPLSQTLRDNPTTAQLRNDLKVYKLRDRLEESRSADLFNYTKENSIQAYSQSEVIKGRSHSLLTCDGHGGVLKQKEGHESIEAIITKVAYRGFFPNALEEHKEEIQTSSKLKEENESEYQFTANFKAVPTSTTYIAPNTISKPRIYSTVTARVSGGQSPSELPSNEDTVDVDNYSRVRVIFHFDPKYPTSCYLRFANFWSGNGWGSQFIPRVNTEVIVSFLNGDPDRPHIIGSLYNQENQIPQSLPANKTQSYIKTRSMPGSKSEYNLLLFEDKQKQELVHIRGQKDYKLHALNNSYINIDNDQTEVIGNDESITIGHDRMESVGNDETISIGHDQSNTIGNDQSNHIVRNQVTKIDKDKVTKIGNHRQDDIFANQEVTIGANFSQTVKGKVDVKAGVSIKETTKLYTIDAKTFNAKAPGGVITIDGGIMLKGDVLIKGSLVISGGAGGSAGFEDVFNEGEDLDVQTIKFSK